MRKFLLGFAFSLSFLSGLAQNLGFSITQGRSRVVIPIEVYDNLIVVPVVLNGKLPLRFILDTGVRTTILTDKAFSDFLHLTYARKYSISGPGGERLIDAYVANNVTIEMPGVHGEGHAMLVLDKDYLELRNYLGVDVHGILGYELFSRFIVEMDYQNNRLTLIQPAHFKPSKRFEKFSITVEDTKPYLYADVNFNDGRRVHAKFLVDTGASHGLLLDPESDSALHVPALHINNIIGRGLGGAITGQIARIRSLDVGSYSLKNVIANFPDINSYSDSIKDNRLVFRNGSIGGEILSRFRIVFDFPHEIMYLKKNGKFKNKFNYNLSGITVRAQGETLHEFQIVNVRARSAAAKASIKEGDIILSIGETMASDLDINKIETILNRDPGKTIVMEIQRDGKKYKVAFILESQI